MQLSLGRHRGCDDVDARRVCPTRSVDSGEDMGIEKNNFRVRITYDGYVTWVPGMKWRTSCPVPLTYFPFDDHVCDVTFINWMHTSVLLQFTVDRGAAAVNDDPYVPNGEWTLESKSAAASDLTFDNVTFYPTVTLSVHLRRLPLYYVVNIVLPVVIISLLSVLVYWLPSESGEKMSLAVTTLLSYVVLLLIISDISPKTGDSLPLICTYDDTHSTVDGKPY